MSPHRTLVKICGVCSAEDASAAAEAGADLIGVVLAPGPRQLSVGEARSVLDAVPRSVARVGVFVDPAVDDVAEVVEALGLDFVQLHGSESPEFCSRVFAPVAKAFRVGPGFDAREVEPYLDRVAFVVMDTLVPGIAGGTGRRFAWDPALRVSGPGFSIAGGLSPDNVGEAIRIMRPAVVDVSSGVEREVRVKDRERVRAFVAAVRAADEEVWGS